jgi:hypothetical protein
MQDLYAQSFKSRSTPGQSLKDGEEVNGSIGNADLNIGAINDNLHRGNGAGSIANGVFLK